MCDASSAPRSTIRAIYEGALSFDRIGIRADILTRKRDRRFDLMEVKSTLDVKPEHEWALVIQFYALEGAGVPVRWPRLMHLNRDWICRGGDYDLKRLFTFMNLPRFARERRRDVVAALKTMRRALAGERAPSIAIGPNCNAPAHSIDAASTWRTASRAVVMTSAWCRKH